MKSLILCIFIFLIVPGSGQLAFDGLPLSTRVEVAALAVLTIAASNRRLRESLRHRTSGAAWRGAIKPTLLVLALAKLLTFTWLPFSDGFDACYRSLYLPLEKTQACEKSYEGPFLSRSDLGLDNTSRIDRTVDFGSSMHDWSLPFMNEYPRLGALWLQRFPFTAQYGAVIQNTTSEDRWLPIYGNGEMSGKLGTNSFDNTSVALADRYEFPRLSLVKVQPGRSEFSLSYRFSDDDALEPPDQAPPVRGPYAQLKIGQPLNRNSILAFAQLRVRGWTLDTAYQRTPDFVVATDGSGEELGRSAPQERPDVAAYVNLPDLTSSGFNFAIPARSPLNGTVEIRAVYGSRSVVIGRITASEHFVPELPISEVVSGGNVRSDFQVWFDADRHDFTALAPDSRSEPPTLMRLLLVALDGVSVFILGGLLLLLLSFMGSTTLVASGFGAAAYGTVWAGSKFGSELLDSRLLLPIGIIAALSALLVRRIPDIPRISFLPAAVVLAADKAFAQLHEYHSSQGVHWWGRLLYYWRDSDWFATQGYARTVFLEGSLRGGEAVFWFQAGPRYLALATRVLLGENDVLVGLILTSLGFFAVFVLYASCSRFLRGPLLVAAGALGLCIALFFMADDLMAGFGFLGSSEFPTWAVLFFITAFIVTTHSESRAWLLILMSATLAYSVQLRPNQVGGVVLIFIALVLLVDRTDRARMVSIASMMLATFVAIVLFSLIHNLYYGETFVPFTANAGINYAFSWRDVLGLDPGPAGWSDVWAQLRFMMYWNAIGNYSWALMFWGSQVCWLAIVGLRLRRGVALKVRSLYLLIPLGYALPMLKYQMTSYYPRHLVVINLSFLCAALMAWPRDEELKPATSPVMPEVAAVQPAPHGISTI